jgi:DNA-binding response OmpR family regulator
MTPEPASAPDGSRSNDNPSEASPILVVEDDPSVRGLLRTLLEVEGYAATCAADGLAGLVKATSRVPPLIVLDLVMPDLGGLRVLDELRADARVSRVPVLVVTGKVDVIASLRDRLGERSVFAKPFDAADLIARVHELAGPPGQAVDGAAR